MHGCTGDHLSLTIAVDQCAQSAPKSALFPFSHGLSVRPRSREHSQKFHVKHANSATLNDFSSCLKVGQRPRGGAIVGDHTLLIAGSLRNSDATGDLGL